MSQRDVDGVFLKMPRFGCVRRGRIGRGRLSFGVDLGTATIVITAIDRRRTPDLLGLPVLRSSARRRRRQLR